MEEIGVRLPVGPRILGKEGVMQELIFVIGPVRNINKATYAVIERWVRAREAEGYKVHWPARGDTKQNDPVGINIYTVNREAIHGAGRVGIWFDGTSKGSVFDLGMTYYFLRDAFKGIEVINETAFDWPNPHLTLWDVILELGISTSPESREEIYRSNEIPVLVDETDNNALFNMGMALASLRDKSKKIVIVNRDQILPTPCKSFKNVFLDLAKAS